MSTIFIILVAALLVWIAYIYNRFIVAKNTVMAAWSDIDVQLKRRHDLIPKLVEAVKQYASYESATISAVTSLRTESRKLQEVSKRGEIEIELGKLIHQLVAIAEDYPDLKASQSFLDLQYNLSEVEQNIQYARRYYNGAVRNLNIRIESFPDLLIARFFRFNQAQYFDFEETI
jgi:LemA protein